MGSSHSSGASSYEIAQEQQKAEDAEKARLEKEAQKSVNETNASSANSGIKASGGTAEAYEGGALSKKKRGSTLAGEGEQTFGRNGSIGG